jgi:hypothetical protein
VLEPEALDGAIALAYALPIRRLPPVAERIVLALPLREGAPFDRAALLAALGSASRSLTILGSRDAVIAAVGRGTARG